MSNLTQNTWTTKRLKYLATINDEALPENTDPDLEISYVDIGNVDSTGISEAPTAYRFENAPSRARRIVKHGDVIISTVRTYLQAIAPIENPPKNLIVSTGFAVVRPMSNELDMGFCKYVLRENSFLSEVEKRSVGVSYPAINSSELGDIFIKIAPLPTQRRIAAYLDQETAHIDALIAAKERLLLLLAEKRQALIARAVTRGLDETVKLKDSGVAWLGEVPEGWTISSIKYVTKKVGSGVTPKGGSEVYKQEGILFLRSQNVHFSKLQLEDVVYISEEVHESMSNSKVENGDVLLNVTGASIGRCFYYEGISGQANVNQHVCIVRPNEKITTKFLNYVLASDVGQNQIGIFQTGGGREGLNFETLKSFVLPLPSIEDQNEIVEFLDIETFKLNSINEATQKTISLLKERRSALIAAAVTGQLNIPES